MAVTRAEVARLADVSPALVSYVLNPGSRPVSAAARARIEAAIAELGYRPNAIAQALRRSTSLSIGLLMPSFTSPLVAYLSEHIEEHARDRGYVLLSGNTRGKPDREIDYLQEFVSRGVDGLILIGTAAPNQLSAAAASGIPIVVIDTVPTDSGVSSVYVDGATGAASAVKHLIDVHGHTRIACISACWPSDNQAERRTIGWRQAMESAGLPAGDDLLVRAQTVDRKGGWDSINHVMDKTDATAVFVTSDIKAVGALDSLRYRGVSVPTEFAVASFDGTALAGSTWPRITTVNQFIPDVAAHVIERLLAKIGKDPEGITHDVLPTALVIHESCGCSAEG